MKAYFEKDGVQYYGYDIVYLGDSGYSNDTIFYDYNVQNKLMDIAQYCDDTFRPQPGDEINIIPDSELALDDIRSTFKIKRGYDTGVCNVFSNLKYSNSSLQTEYYCIIPSLKVIVMQKSDWRFAASLTKDEVIKAIGEPSLPADAEFFNKWFALYTKKVSPAYFELLDGTLKKPAITCKNLDIVHNNNLTADALYLVYKLGKKEHTRENREAFILQLKSLSQTNWRDYPETINLLRELFLGPYCTGSSVLYSPYSVPKQIRVFCTEVSSNKTEKEFLMCQDLLKMILDIKSPMFVSFEDFNKKLNDNDIRIEIFNKYFNNIIKIQEKKYSNE